MQGQQKVCELYGRSLIVIYVTFLMCLWHLPSFLILHLSLLFLNIATYKVCYTVC